MMKAQLQAVVNHVHRVGSLNESQARSDRELLSQFASRRDTQAFTAIVERHGSLVLGVCRRLLSHQDAEDAFQATFLVLAQKPDTVRKGESLSNWLHGVSYRIALKIRRSYARRKKREQRPRSCPESNPVSEVAWREIQTILDEEIQRLPEKYRTVFVQCCLESRTRVEAARELNLNEGTVSSRLDQAKKRLRKQLTRRGVTLGAALVILSRNEAVSRAAIRTTLETVLRAKSDASSVFSLAQGVNISMKSKIKWAALFLLALAILPTGLWKPTSDALQAQEKPKTQSLLLKGQVVNEKGQPIPKSSVSIWMRNAKSTSKTFTDDQGRFELRVSPSEAESGILVAKAQGLIADWIPLRLRKSDADLTLRPVKDQIIEGRIVDLQGQPVRGVSVTINGIESPVKKPDLTKWIQAMVKYYGGPRIRPVPIRPQIPAMKRVKPTVLGVKSVVKTDQKGRFQIRGVGRERTVSIQVQGQGLANTSFSLLTRAGKVNGLPDWIKTAKMTAVIAPGKEIFGVILDGLTKKPVKGARVHTGVASAVTNAKGEYRLRGVTKRDEHHIWVYSSGFFAQQRRVASSPGIAPMRLNLELEKGVPISGRVIDSMTGKPVRGTLLYLVHRDNENLKKFTSFGNPGIIPSSARVKEDGSFEMLTIPGKGLICVTAEDKRHYTPARIKNWNGGLVEGIPSGFHPSQFHAVIPIQVDEAKPESLRHRIQLVPGVQREILLVDPQDKPVVGAEVAGREPVRESERFRPPKGAKAMLYGLDSKMPRNIVIYHKERKLGAVVPVRGDKKTPLRISLQPLSSIRGVALDQKGRPLGNMKVTVGLTRLIVAYRDLPWSMLRQMAGTMKRVTKTDSKGRFHVDGLLPGIHYTLSISEGNPTRANLRAVKDKVIAEQGRVVDLGIVRPLK